MVITPESIADLLDSGRALSGGGPALWVDDEACLSHADLNRLLLRAETDLRCLGVRRETRVMTALPDGPLTACVLLALIRSAVCAPVNPDLRQAELESLIPELGAEALVAHGGCAAEARRAAAALGLPVIEVEWNRKDALFWSGRTLPECQPSAAAARPDDTALVLLTSGSSARPKRVPLTHRHLTLSSRRMARSIALERGDCCLNMMPMFHVGAVVDLLLAPLSVGGSLLRPDTMSVPAFYEALKNGRPTWFQGVPTLLHELATHALRTVPAPPKPASLRLIRSVSAPLPPEWHGGIQAALGVPVIEIYGMTETAGVITSNPWPPEPRRTGSVGKPTGLEVIVRDTTGAEAEAGKRGEILVRGPGVMRGYENPVGGESGMAADDWLKTGDEGFFDKDGYLFITGRIGEQINRGGEKIAPREIDEVLAAHPAVRSAAAFALPHPHLGQDVAAAVVPHPGMEISAENLSAHLSRQLAHFKVPKSYFLLPELPYGPGGKLRRRLLPELVRNLPPLTGRSSDTGELPQTEMEKQVAVWWEKELGVSNVSRLANFFDLGGDSLTAASFSVGVEKALGLEIRPAALFDHPTVAAFAGYLDQAAKARGAGVPAEHSNGRPSLNPEFHRRLLAAMSVWPGERLNEFSLLVGLRTNAPGVPVFWCGQGRGEFENLDRQIPADQPLYGTRSLFLFEGKNRHDETALAILLAREIETARAGREIIVGGFCAGGRIAFEAACQLRAGGVPVKMVFMHEAFMPRAIDVPVAMAFSEGYVLSPYRRFHRPEAAMAKKFTGGWKVWQLREPHEGVYGIDSLQQEVRKLRALWEDPSGFESGPSLEELSPAAYRARLSCRLYPRLIGAGWRGWARVTVTNLSHHSWPPGKRSGLHLGHRWLGLDGQPCGDPGPSVPLPREVAPGDSIPLIIRMTAPTRASRIVLEVDMVDEGLSWFSEKDSNHPSEPLRLKIDVLDRRSFRIFGKRHDKTSP